jgi:hypothetical protein
LSPAGRLAALLGLALTLIASPAAAGTADRVGATFGLMAEDFIQSFKPIEGMVVAVEGDVMYIDVGSDRGAQAGQEFTVFRKGEPFHHPYTGKALGHYEEILGYAQVRRTEPQFSETLFVPAPDRPRPHAVDGVRISRGRIKVAVAPLMDLTDSRADVRRVPYLLGTALERSGRFQSVDPILVADMFADTSLRVEEVLVRPERAVRAARNLNVSAWLVPVLIERRGVTYLDVTLVSAITGTALLSRRQPLVSAATAEEQRFPWEPRAED